jgi:hypothetical protein
MGKVLNTFMNGFPGTPSRTADEIIITMQNGSARNIYPGDLVFLKTDGSAEGFDLEYPQEFEMFLGFAVRCPDRTPDVAVTSQNNPTTENSNCPWRPNETMEVLVRGAITVPMAVSANRGSEIYVRKSDGKLVASPGASGSTIELENVKLRNARDTVSGCAEVIVNKRNII